VVSRGALARPGAWCLVPRLVPTWCARDHAEATRRSAWCALVLASLSDQTLTVSLYLPGRPQRARRGDGREGWHMERGLRVHGVLVARAGVALRGSGCSQIDGTRRLVVSSAGVRRARCASAHCNIHSPRSPSPGRKSYFSVLLFSPFPHFYSPFSLTPPLTLLLFFFAIVVSCAANV